MTSADPIVDRPLNSQGWNRYSYVYNRPLAFTDPTGFVGLWPCCANASVGGSSSYVTPVPGPAPTVFPVWTPPPIPSLPPPSDPWAHQAEQNRLAQEMLAYWIAQAQPPAPVRPTAAVPPTVAPATSTPAPATPTIAPSQNGGGIASAANTGALFHQASCIGGSCTLNPLESGPRGGAVGRAGSGRAPGLVAIGNWLSTIFNSNRPPPLPETIIGNNPRQTRGRTNTDLPASDFPGTVEDLTGGHVHDDPEGTGHMCCDNGVRIRPGDRDGPRIDIPQNGQKPRETIHFPPGTTWPW